MTSAVHGQPEQAITAHGVSPPRSLYGHGYALVLSSALTSAIGMVFWIVAARNYDQAVVGRNSALVYAIMFLAGVAQLNLMNVLIRFVLVAGARARRLVAVAYVVGGGLAGLAGLVFALGVRWWSPGLAGLLDSPYSVAGCAGACAVWAIFVMQDGVLTAVGRARVVPVENLVFSVVKLGLLAALAAALPSGGITVAWMAATAVAVLATTGYLFLHALPAHEASATTDEEISFRALAGYLIGDFLGATCWIACTQLLPVLVLGVLGAVPTATFATAWAIAYALYLVPAAMGQSLVAHTAHDPERATAARAGVERRSLLLLLPAVAALVLAAPWVLHLLGPGYADAGRWVLPLMAVSALPNVVVAAAVSQARALRRTGVVATLLGSLSVLVLSLALVLMPIFDITGVGLALLAGQTILASVILWLRADWTPRPIIGPLAGVRSRALLRRIAPTALGSRSWRVQHRLHGRSDSAIATVGPGDQCAALLKVADTEEGRQALLHEVNALLHLRENPRLDGWRHLAPDAYDVGNALGASYSLQELLPGTDARARVTDPSGRARFTAAALSAIGGLHRRTAGLTRVDDRLIRQHVTDPAALVRAAVPPRAGAVVDRLVAELSADLRDRRLPVGWVHGDFSPDNVLLDADDRVTGIVDWGQATSAGLVAVDVAGLVLATDVAATGRELGAVIATWLAPGSEPALADVLHKRSTLGGDPVPVRTLVLLGWLHMVSANLAKSSRYSANPIWLRRNLVAVLRALRRELP
ncbi:aminoglycoside phosphotransferase family protein [Amycolatopsis sp. FDAARGOS 1241]|uniref:aminoglycoside phosphotransferase family protein n=1 Tax=Amycolatopsis sp. FDAARGOS 1241 TaxID=2778070 RepID=UPI0019516497|nr:aminoglycoside phosphotransferase family protein [Amycolatopsis sp. FDAARGOS 1241]QRP47877.1 aminoglycoside phosphotransferase family protein [Amycolatopsis sp. FDAARGOS 1241]